MTNEQHWKEESEQSKARPQGKLDEGDEAAPAHVEVVPPPVVEPHK